MAGSGASSIAPAKAIPPAISAAQRIGVDVPRAIATESPLVKLGGQVLAKTPGGGALYKSIERSTEQLGEAAKTAIERSGGTADANVAGESYRTGIEQSFKPGIKKAVGDLYDKVDAGVNNNILHKLGSTTQIAGDIAGTHASYGSEWGGAGANLIVNAIQRPEGLSYQAIKNLRTRIGEMLDTGTFPEGTSESELRKVYGGLSDDLRTAVSRAGSPEALANFEQANAAARYAAQWKDKIETVLGTAKRSDESIASALHRMANKGEGADIKTLSAARKAVPAKAWQDITANSISRLGKDKAGNFSPQRFVSDYGNLSDAGKRLLFSGAGASDLLPFLDDINEVSKKFVSAGKFANPAGTGSHVGAMGMGAALMTAAEQLASGEWKGPLAIISGVVGANLTARFLGSPASVASMARWSRAYDALVHKPGPASLATFNMVTRNLANTVADQAGVPAATIEQKIQQQIKQSAQGPDETPAQ